MVVDGHRFPLTGIIRNLPDPNFIPPNAIERVEVLAEGASSIYGSDAVAGVLNFITRRKFEGLEVTGQYGFGDDYKNWSTTLSLGSRWETGGGAVFYSYSDRGRLAIADRPFVGADQRSRGGSNFGTFACSPASFQPAGQSLIFLYPYNQPGIVNIPANAPCDPVGRSDLIPQERRHSVMVKLDQEVGDRLTLSGDVAFSSRSSMMQTSVTVAHGQGSTPTVPQVITATVFGPGSGKEGQINPFYVNPAGLEGATHTFLVPSDLAAILDSGVALPRSLRQVLLGSAPVLPPLLRRARAALPGVELLAVYGMTEILPVAIATAEEKLAHDGDLLGRPLPGVRARVAEDGELMVSGPNLCRGYLGSPPLTEHATGDLARLEGDLIVLTGRKKDMILRKGTNVYPGLYEPAITRLLGVAAAVMIGVPDEIGDERIVLVLVPAPDAGPGLAARVQASLPDLIDVYALPDEVVVLPELPLSGRTRKIDRSALRTRLAR